jgi:hypothetical protein
MLVSDGVGVFIIDTDECTSEGFFKSIGRLVKALAQLPNLMPSSSPRSYPWP